MQGIPDELPYTVAAEEFRTDPWLGSTADVLVSEEQVTKREVENLCIIRQLQGEFVNLDKIDEEDLDPASDDEQIQIRIEDVKPTVPVNITKNGGLMTIGSESSIQARTCWWVTLTFHLLAGVDGDVADCRQVAQVRLNHVDAAQDLSNLRLPIRQSCEHA